MHLAKVTSIIKDDAYSLAGAMSKDLQQLSGTTLLITGAGGFLCSFILDVLAAANERVLDRPCHVLALDNFRSGVPERIEHLENHKDITFIEHDLRMKFVPAQKVDWIIHGASIASPPFYRKFPLETIDVNVTGTRYMLDLCKDGARSLLYLSTSEIYGDPIRSSFQHQRHTGEMFPVPDQEPAMTNPNGWRRRFARLTIVFTKCPLKSLVHSTFTAPDCE